MRFRPRPPFFGPQPPTWRKLAAALLLACTSAALAPSTQAQTRLPTLGDGNALGTHAERQLGDSIIRHLYRDPDYIDDPILVEYVQTLWQALLGAARERGELSPELDEYFAWEVLLGKDRSVNAFALPGGYLGVHLGLIAVVGNRDELASVLAHELSHVTQRHIARLMDQQGKQTPLMLGAMVLGALAASKNPGAAQALIVGGQAAAMQNQLNFSRDMEREADRIGFGLMEPAGFAPQGFVGMFDKLQQANRLNDNGSWPYLRSHPLTTQRMADMQSRQIPGNAHPATPATLEHALLTARARVLANPSVDALRQWQTEPDSSGFDKLALARRASALYASALATLQLKQPAAARSALQRLQALVQADPSAQRQARLLATEIALTTGDAETALRTLPANSQQRPELLLRAQTLLRLGRSAESVGALQTWVVTHPRDASAWQSLASAWQAQGQTLRAIRAEAEAHVAHYDYAAAVDRFKAGQEWARKTRVADDFMEASIIDTRLHAVQALLKQQAAER